MIKLPLTILLLLCSDLSAQVWKTYIPYNKKGRWGYADTGCKIKVQPFSVYELGFFNEYGLAYTSDSNGRQGLINTAFKTVLPPKYDDIHIEHGRYIRVGVSAWRYKLYGINGQPLLPFEFGKIVFSKTNPDYVLVFSSSDVVSVYRYDSKLKKLLFKRKHEAAGKAEFVDHVHYAISYHYSMNRKVFDLATGATAAFDHDMNGRYGSGRGRGDGDGSGWGDEIISVAESEDKPRDRGRMPYRYTDSVAPEIVFQQIQINYHNKNLQHVRYKGKWGVISLDRKVIVPLVYDTILYSRSYSPYANRENDKILGWLCCLNGKYGIVSTDTARNIPFAYDKLSHFSASFIMAKSNGKYGVLNHFGDTVIAFEVDSFKYGFSGSLDWATFPHELVLYAVKDNKIALYGTLGGKTDYVIDKTGTLLDRRNVYGYYKGLRLHCGHLYGYVFSAAGGFIYMPCAFLKASELHEIIGPYRYFKVQRQNAQYGYVDNRGRKYFED